VLLIGIDEAGYGPTLGPLCHGLCVLRVPGDTGTAPVDPWVSLSPLVSRCPAPPTTIAVDDSKKLYDGHTSLPRLSHSVACFLACREKRAEPPRGGLLDELLPPEELTRAQADPWDRALAALPDAASSSEAARALADSLRRNDMALLHYSSRALPARLFNERLTRLGNKADVAWERVVELLRLAEGLARSGESSHVVVDRQGGRKFYGPRLQELCPETVVWTEEERAERSAYRWDRRGATTRVEFLEKADSLSFPVALASLAAKLTRELLMARLNAFFLAHDPKLKPTAGYPSDAQRFLKQTKELRQRLQIPDDAFIRQR
jgi:ribonuclease HII